MAIWKCVYFLFSASLVATCSIIFKNSWLVWPSWPSKIPVWSQNQQKLVHIYQKLCRKSSYKNIMFSILHVAQKTLVFVFFNFSSRYVEVTLRYYLTYGGTWITGDPWLPWQRLHAFDWSFDFCIQDTCPIKYTCLLFVRCP